TMNACRKTILVAGGAGYIGSHTVVELLNAGHRVVVVDNLSNSQENLSLVFFFNLEGAINGRNLILVTKNVCDLERLNLVFDSYNIDVVFDFSGRKAVGESTLLPMLYYKYNINGTMNLLKCMRQHEVRDILFSSSCTVYGAPDQEALPIKEDDSVGCCQCPYAKCKYFVECLLSDLATGEPDYWRIMVMRYFNPVGAHESGLIGEDPKGDPLNLLPKLAQVATGKRPILDVYGEDYSTVDGSPIRDYVHVMDVATAHLRAVKHFQDISGIEIYNIGTGEGKSTWDMVKAFEAACGKPIPFRVCQRRPGDVPAIYCDPSKAERELGWKAGRSLKQMCEDLWRFYVLNPNGYDESI
uniref:UDP-glucose 4-epimerase n=1 Tax=Ciona savignyi TaxID=51511 RepID=H2YZ73_CIOSA